MNHPRREQYRRAFRAGRLALPGALAAMLGLYLLVAGADVAGVLLLAIAGMLALRVRHCVSLAARSGVGARSEDEVQRVLDPLRCEGWWVRHSVSWPGGGDVDSVLVAPSGVAFAIETKTRAYDERHLRRVREQAAWLGRRRRRYGAVPVLCVVRAAGVERYEHSVLVVSIDRLVPVLWEVTNSMDGGQSMQLGGRSVA
jgi:Nuclease-related domain